MQAIGFLELNSIARGVEVADIMLKTADVKLVVAKPSCPGKYVIFVTGNVAAVNASIDAGGQIGKNNVLDKIVIANIHPQVIQAINMTAIPPAPNAVGVMEFFDITTSIIAADAAVKAADITLIDIRLGIGIGGKSFVVLAGEVSAVEEALKCGAAFGEDKGMLVNKVVIPKPHEDLFQSLF
ncbi:MAG: BMC domain-containing protein [Spirochaetes bacterium]|nr:BMC domain-containing protein [Spirochaetota bacterium]